MTPLFRGDWHLSCQMHLVLRKQQTGSAVLECQLTGSYVALLCIKNAAIQERPTALNIHWVENGNLEVRWPLLGVHLLLLECHRAVRHKKLYCTWSVKTRCLAAEVSDRRIPSTCALRPIQVPATFRLVLGTRISSVLWGVHGRGEENTYLAIQGWSGCRGSRMD